MLPLENFQELVPPNLCDYANHNCTEEGLTFSHYRPPSKWLMGTSHSCSALFSEAFPQRLWCQGFKGQEYSRFTKQELLPFTYRLFKSSPMCRHRMQPQPLHYANPIYNYRNLFYMVLKGHPDKAITREIKGSETELSPACKESVKMKVRTFTATGHNIMKMIFFNT